MKQQIIIFLLLSLSAFLYFRGTKDTSIKVTMPNLILGTIIIIILLQVIFYLIMFFIKHN